jgi:hypothetical protein
MRLRMMWRLVSYADIDGDRLTLAEANDLAFL